VSKSPILLHITSKFDSSLDRNEPFEFGLGKGQVIRAFDMGVATMRKGEKCMLTCGPTYAYGAAGSPPNIPPNSTLKFELEMMGWKGQDLSKDGDGGIERFIVTKSEKKKTPNDGAFVKCHITGRLGDRVIEDRDVEFNIGEGEEFGVITGVETALEKMNQGETSRLVVKPKYAFGPDGNEQLQVPANSTVEYTVTLNDFEKGVESWKLDKEESLEQAKIFKEKGTNYFKMSKVRMALKFYEKCHSFLSNCGELSFPRHESRRSQSTRFPITDTSVDGEAKVLSLSVYLNKALCHQKLNDLEEVRHAVSSSMHTSQ
jgi:FK506-binding protein 4/5